jgi:hypothetical protein
MYSSVLVPTFDERHLQLAETLKIPLPRLRKLNVKVACEVEDLHQHIDTGKLVGSKCPGFVDRGGIVRIESHIGIAEIEGVLADEKETCALAAAGLEPLVDVSADELTIPLD